MDKLQQKDIESLSHEIEWNPEVQSSKNQLLVPLITQNQVWVPLITQNQVLVPLITQKSRSKLVQTPKTDNSKHIKHHVQHQNFTRFPSFDIKQKKSINIV